ncbi:D-amino acid dehydrogenase small subunit [Halalkalicoccus paucihalophilus]|uniref:D-amino acid dehydrogenase small subunit n=1 Tax=Halalkalicoccus paucihalophilus TaxID=1008153 RepID=A0A151AJH9_9EURY|nr:FAD-dependent oxidoreductase [Halalkalicoccus paucihalophilus]KYH27725.1 D-amino acid dehydrogenase small subunit [Halalkalicoccus paucihalophilus]
MTRIAVIGGGAVGLTAAHDLARAGEDVTVFERGALASGSTDRAAGVLYDAYAGEIDARIGKRSIERFREFSVGDGFEFHETPYVWFAQAGDERRGSAIREQVSEMCSRGIDAGLLDERELTGLAPDLETNDIGTAALARNAGWTDPATYAGMMATKARKTGVEIRTDTPAALAEAGVNAGGDREPFETVVVAAGAHTKRVLEKAGRSIAMKPYRVQALVLDAAVETPMGYDASAGFYFRPHPDGLLVGDGTEDRESDPEGWDRASDAGFVASARERAGERLGLAEPPVERAWAGLCTATPDGDPLLGWLEEGLYVATGWQGHGFMRAPALGEVIAREVRGESGVEPFDPTRFTGEEEFPIVEGLAL